MSVKLSDKQKQARKEQYWRYKVEKVLPAYNKIPKVRKNMRDVLADAHDAGISFLRLAVWVDRSVSQVSNMVYLSMKDRKTKTGVDARLKAMKKKLK